MISEPNSAKNGTTSLVISERDIVIPYRDNEISLLGVEIHNKQLPDSTSASGC